MENHFQNDVVLNLLVVLCPYNDITTSDIPIPHVPVVADKFFLKKFYVSFKSCIWSEQQILQ